MQMYKLSSFVYYFCENQGVCNYLENMFVI